MRRACIPKMAAAGVRVEGAVWTSRQEPLLAAALSLLGVITAAALRQVKVEHLALSVGFSTEKKCIRLADGR